MHRQIAIQATAELSDMFRYVLDMLGDHKMLDYQVLSPRLGWVSRMVVLVAASSKLHGIPYKGTEGKAARELRLLLMS